MRQSRKLYASHQMFTSTMDTSLWHFNWLRFWMRPFIIDATQQLSLVYDADGLSWHTVNRSGYPNASTFQKSHHPCRSVWCIEHTRRTFWLITPSSVILSTAQQYATSPSTSNNSKQIATNETMWVIAAHVTIIPLLPPDIGLLKWNLTRIDWKYGMPIEWKHLSSE